MTKSCIEDMRGASADMTGVQVVDTSRAVAQLREKRLQVSMPAAASILASPHNLFRLTCTMSCMRTQRVRKARSGFRSCSDPILLQVDLRLPASGRFSQLDPSLAGIEDDLGEAIDQTAGINDPDVALIVALKWMFMRSATGELSDHCHKQRQQNIAALQQQELAILQDKYTALQAASNLQGHIKVGGNKYCMQ